MACKAARPTWLFLLLLAACTHLTPMQPRPRSRVPAPVPATATDFEYFDANPLMVPVHGVRPDKVVDSFYEKRSEGRIHQAIDILAPRGTPVVAAAAGRVLRMSQSTAGGITIYMTDVGRRFIYYYAHLDRYSDWVSEGVAVEQGNVLGYVGTSGNAPPETPHLHFQAMRLDPGRRDWWNGTAVDVRPFLRTVGTARER